MGDKEAIKELSQCLNAMLKMVGRRVISNTMPIECERSYKALIDHHEAINAAYDHIADTGKKVETNNNGGIKNGLWHKI